MNPLALAAEARAAAQLREALGTLLDPDDDELVQDTLDGETSLIDMIRQAMAAQEHDEADALYVKQRLDQLGARKARIEQRIKARKLAVARAMLVAGVKTLREPEWTLSARDGCMSVLVTDESRVPQSFWRQKPPPPPEVDRAAVKVELEAGHDVPGAELKRGEPVLTRRT